MAYLLSYTKKGADCDRELNDSMHLAISYDGINYRPLRWNTGILFPEAELEEGGLAGCSKTLLEPWLFRFADGTVGVIAVRREKANQPDRSFRGCAVIYQTEDLAVYRKIGFIKLSDAELKRPACQYDAEKGKYYLEWETEQGAFGGWTAELKSGAQVTEMCEAGGNEAYHGEKRGEFKRKLCCCQDMGIADSIPSNVLEISVGEAERLELMLETPVNRFVEIPAVGVKRNTDFHPDMLPKAVCRYSDGSVHEMEVDWDADAIARMDTREAGEYQVGGTVRQRKYPVPFTERTGDPSIVKYRGRYLMTWSGERNVTIRSARTLEGLSTAEPQVIYTLPEDQPEAGCMWAPEFHEINGKLFLFTTVGLQGKWYTVKSCVLECNGEPENPEKWSEPVYCIKQDGSLLNEEGITLDMTCFCIDGIWYVMWSNRILAKQGYETNEFGRNADANLCIASIDPEQPWKLTSEPVCICRPKYGWDRIENEINEGPYLLAHGEDLFVTFSGSSIGTLYCVGLLKARRGSDLLKAESWMELPYPVLVKESVPGQYGPGHNNFVKAPDGSGDDLMVLHYRPLPLNSRNPEEMEEKNPRNSAIRRVHWNVLGMPVFDMQPEQELRPEWKQVVCTVKIEE